MQKNEQGVKEEFLKRLMGLEDLAGKKAKIYSRLLTDAALAGDMEQLSLRHGERKITLEKLLYGKCEKSKKGQGRCEMNEGEEEK